VFSMCTWGGGGCTQEKRNVVLPCDTSTEQRCSWLQRWLPRCMLTQGYGQSVEQIVKTLLKNIHQLALLV